MSTRTAMFLLDEAKRAHAAGVHAGAVLCAAAAIHIQLLTEASSQEVLVPGAQSLEQVFSTLRHHSDAHVASMVAQVSAVADSLSSYVEPFGPMSLEARERERLLSSGEVPETEDVLDLEAASAIDTADRVVHRRD